MSDVDDADLNICELEVYDTELVELGDYDCVDTGALGPGIGMIIRNVKTGVSVVTHQLVASELGCAIAIAREEMPPIEDHRVYVGGASIVGETNGDTCASILEDREDVQKMLIAAGYTKEQIQLQFNKSFEYSSMRISLEDGMISTSYYWDGMYDDGGW